MKYNIYIEETDDNSKITILVTTKILFGSNLLEGSLDFDTAIKYARDYMSAYQMTTENTLVQIIIR